MRQKKTLLALTALLAIIFGLAYWDEWQSEQDEKAESANKRLVGFAADDVTAIDYSDRGGGNDQESETAELAAGKHKKYRLVKSNGAWSLVEPTSAKADESAIDSFLKSITDYQYEKVVTSDKTRWTEFGVAEPRRTISFSYQPATEQENSEEQEEEGAGHQDRAQDLTLYIGETAKVGYSTYFRLSGSDNVYIGSQHLLIATGKSSFDFRDKTIVEFDSAKVSRIDFQPADRAPAIAIFKNAAGKFLVSQAGGVAHPADEAEVKDFLDDIKHARAIGFNDAPTQHLYRFLKAPAGIKLTWTIDDQKTTLMYRVKGDKVLAAFDPKVRHYHIDGNFEQKLKKTLMSFRNRRVLNIRAEDVATIKVDADVYSNVNGEWYPEEVAAQFDDDGQFTGSDAQKPKESDHIRSLLVDLEFGKTEAFIDANDAAVKKLEVPMHRIEVKFRDGFDPIQTTIDLFKIDGDQSAFFTKVSGAAHVYKFKKSVFESMKPSQQSGDTDDNQSGKVEDIAGASTKSSG